MSRREPPNQLALCQPYGLPSNRNLRGRPHRNRGRLEPKESRLPKSLNAPRRTVHQRDDARGRHHRDCDDDRKTGEYAGEVSARLVQRRWSRHANEAERAPACR